MKRTLQPGEQSEKRSGSPQRLLGWWGALAGGLLALPGVVALWGFSVDDAFIPARVAAHLLAGRGPVFNPDGPVTDAVTPLGFAHFEALWAGALGVEAETALVLELSRWAGVCAWLLAAALLGREIARLGGARAETFLLAGLGLLTCVPLAAWSGSGLETPWVTLLATWAVCGGRQGAAQRTSPEAESRAESRTGSRTTGADLCAGWAMAWRPELGPWALVLVGLRRWHVGKSDSARAAARRVLRGVPLVLGPALLVGALRWWLFGRFLPLSFLAKEPEFGHGLRYAIGATLLTGPFWLLLSRATLRAFGQETSGQETSVRRGLLPALAAHGVALVFAGGDWMPLFRLMVPVLPGVLLAAAEITVVRAEMGQPPRRPRVGPLWPNIARGAFTVAAGALLWAGHGDAARRVMERRLQLIEESRPLLETSARIAAVDVGWIGVAAPRAEIVDLVGVTDPRVAALPGGHTTKRVAPGLLSARDVDTLVFLAAVGQPEETWYDGWFRYGVEARLAPAAAAMGFRLVGRARLPGTDWEYLVCKAQDGSPGG